MSLTASLCSAVAGWVAGGQGTFGLQHRPNTAPSLLLQTLLLQSPTGASAIGLCLFSGTASHW